MPAELLVASHRGPVSYRTVRGQLVANRGGGGLIGVVGPVVERFGGTWIAAAMTPEDRRIAADGVRDEGGFHLRFLDLPRDEHAGHYDTVCNEHLWYVFHYLYDLAESPSFGASFWKAWDGYRAVNRVYAQAVLDAPAADVVLVHDYHLMTLTAEARRIRRLRAPVVYFHHVPWSEPEYFGLLPAPIVQELLGGMLAHDVAGFHCSRWAAAFLRCCERLLAGARVSSDSVTWRGRTTKVIVAPAPIDADAVVAAGTSPAADARLEALEAERGGRRVLVRVERIDLSKNVLRGLQAFEALLERRPQMADDVWFLAFGYASRTKVARYRRYRDACSEAAARINERFRSGADGPLRFDVRDDYPRSLAGLRIADATLVNPVFDGLNLVAKEGAVLNGRDGALVLSRNAGVYEELGDAALGVNPFDVRATADAIEQALDMGDAERRRRAARLRRAAKVGTPDGWLRGQLQAAAV